MRLRILLDCDGVLADFVRAYLWHVNKIHARRIPTAYSPDDVTQWDIASALSLSKETEDEASAIMGRPGECLKISAYLGSSEGVRMLQELGDVHIVTTPFPPSETWTSQREKWLAVHYGIPRSRVCHAYDKTIVAGDVLIDDKTSTLVAWKRAHPGGVAILWDRPWNRGDAWSGMRATSWQEVADGIKYLGGTTRRWHNEER